MVNLVLVILSYMFPHTLLEALNSPLNKKNKTQKKHLLRERERERAIERNWSKCLPTHKYFYA